MLRSSAGRKIKRSSPINDIVNPAIDSPLGVLNTPTKEKTSPKTHKIHAKTGINPKK